MAVLGCLLSCRKEQPANPEKSASPSNTDTLKLDQVKQWYSQQTVASSPSVQGTQHEFGLFGLRVSWEAARSLKNRTGNYWLVPLEGTPTFKKTKQGYRKLAFLRDSTGAIQARILEFIPDGLYFQRKRKVTTADYTGRIFVYDRFYHLLGGELMAGGKPIGSIKPAAPATGAAPKMHTFDMAVTEDCEWYDDNYIDADGGVVIYSERICSLTTNGGGSTGGLSDGGGDNAGNGDEGGTSASAPAVSDLPGELGPAVNPKNLMDCFGTIPDAGASMKVTVYVQEPWPGTSFNIGPNSVGHVAIGLTKTNGAGSITQVLGFYPNATGFDKLHAPSKIVNNGGDLDYNVSISYSVTLAAFKQIMNYVSSPPGTYDLTDFNCTSFVYYACQAGNITLPNPYTTVGLPTPTGPTTAMTPAGLGNSIQNLKGKNNVNTSGGITPNSKGPCN